MQKNLVFAPSDVCASINTKVAGTSTLQNTSLSSFFAGARICASPTSEAKNIVSANSGKSNAFPPVSLKKQHDRMTPAEAAFYLGVEEATLATWRSTRRYNLEYIKVGRKIFYSQAALDKFITSRTVKLDE